MFIDELLTSTVHIVAEDACPAGRLPRPPKTLGRGWEFAVQAVPLGLSGTYDDQGLTLVFDADTGMVVSYRVNSANGSLRVAAGTVVDALRELHVPLDSEVEVVCGGFNGVVLIGLVKMMTGRVNVSACEEPSPRQTFAEITAEIGRQVRAVAAYEFAIGRVALESEKERQLFLECVIDRVLYWYHKRPAAVMGFKSPIERFASRNVAGVRVPSRC